MITVRTTPCSISFEGHAPGDTGQNLNCAGASAIVQTAIEGLRVVAHIPLTCEIRHGWVYADWKPPLTTQARTILNTMLEGLRHIEGTQVIGDDY